MGNYKIPFNIIFFVIATCTIVSCDRLSFPKEKWTQHNPNLVRHPLDPLTEDEIRLTASIIQTLHPYNWTFNYISLKEPKKAVLLPYFLRDENPPLRNIPRKSFVVLLDRKSQRTFEVTVNLRRRQVEKWVSVQDGLQPAFTFEEMLDAEATARRDPEVIRRCTLLGFNNLQLVNGDQWSMGYFGDRPEYVGKRLLQLYMYGRNFDGDNEYAHPFDFITIIDVNERRVIAIEDLPTHEDFNAKNKQGNIVPRATSNYHPDLRDPNSFRDVKPVTVSNPNGVSFRITGNEIQWQKFKMRLGFNGREGPVIYNVNYKDGAQVRPLFYRMSLAEVFIPYGDPRSPYHRKYVFDEGEYGIGLLIEQLTAQQHCVGEIYFFDAILHTEAGEPRKVNRTVCVHEEDAGILWKHTDFRTGRSSLVRSQRLAITFIANLGNYDYLHVWHFYQDGTIEFNVKLSGILSTNLLAKGSASPPYGSVVFPQVYAQYHQHYFTLRLDAEIDGNNNTVVMTDVVPLPSKTGSLQNPYGQGFTTKTTVLRTASAARTSTLPKKSRTWNIRNPNKINRITNEPVSWKLTSWPPTPQFMTRTDSPAYDKAQFLDHTTWITPYHDEQMFPGGFYLNNTGLHEWVAKNPTASVDNTDIVLWFNLGVTHIPKTEDFPVMNVENCGIMLKPVNFFNENPALDVPGPKIKRKRDEL